MTRSDGLDRREFLRGSAAAGVALSLLPLAASAAEPPRVRRRVTLGRTGIQIGDIGFGSSRLDGDEALVRHALDRGIDYFDTAESYAGGASEEDRQLLATIKSMHEQNPMLGLRGCRLGLMIPDFVKIQTRAILNAQIAVRKAGGNPIAKIMIPLVGHVNELARTREILEAEARSIEEAAPGVDVDYKFGTMIEVPRGALTADEIARDAAFFSFGTNDLTQMTFGYSRDDAEGGFLLKYVEDGILPVNPFQTLDDAVAGLMKVAVDKGRATRPDLEIGICGEHGGDPASIMKCEKLGLDYVSCSLFRVPVARLAAAQAALTSAAERDK